MTKQSILLLVLLIALVSACHAVLSRDNERLVQGLAPEAVAAEAPASGPVRTTRPDIDKNRLLGHINPAVDEGFSPVRPAYGSRRGLYLLSEVYDAFIAMHNAAKGDGISLVIVSATRNFDAQKRIWERKWTGERRVDGRNLAEAVPEAAERARIILKYSSMPGTSRHHWGTDIDINSVENDYFQSDEGMKVFAWLKAHAGEFGFCQTYTAKGNDRPTGYEEEPWHWSYCPTAKRYLEQYIAKVTYADIRGFEGSDTAAELDVIRRYVKGINPRCLAH